MPSVWSSRPAPWFNPICRARLSLAIGSGWLATRPAAWTAWCRLDPVGRETLRFGELLVLYDAPGADRKEGEHTVFGDLLRHD